MSNEIALKNSFPSPVEFQTMKELGKMAVGSGFLPNSINTPEKAVIIMLKGRELGIPPMQAFSSIAVVNGKPTMSAELMLSMIYRNIPGAIVDFKETTATVCRIKAKRPQGSATEFSFTMEDAKRANLTGKGPWVTYPAAMLRARCISAMARAMFPDALSGVVYTPEELGAEIDDEGDVITVPPSPPAEEPKAVEKPNPRFTREVGPAVHADPGEFVCVLPKFRDKKLKEIDPLKLDGYVDFWRNTYKGELSPTVIKFLEFAEPYLERINGEKGHQELDQDLQKRIEWDGQDDWPPYAQGSKS